MTRLHFKQARVHSSFKWDLCSNHRLSNYSSNTEKCRIGIDEIIFFNLLVKKIIIYLQLSAGYAHNWGCLPLTKKNSSKIWDLRSIFLWFSPSRGGISLSRKKIFAVSIWISDIFLPYTYIQNMLICYSILLWHE